MVSDANCIFCRMANGQMDVQKLAENASAFAIRDIHPAAPVHILVIPRDHIPSASDVTTSDGAIISDILALSREVAASEGVLGPGYRLVINVGDDAGATIPHLHMHVLGGRKLGLEG